MNKYQTLKPQRSDVSLPGEQGHQSHLPAHDRAGLTGQGGAKGHLCPSRDRHLKEEPPGLCQPPQSYLQMLSHSQSNSA